ncbi:MAG: glycosyltransferase family 4 protein [Oscillospiraceae bacterium]|nr:glycosyltransferase family 4 protein [Oscillospiraceae bacterium]
MKKLCIVVQRYGNEIVGGSESLTMQYAQKLKEYYDIEIITTTCLDYNTWENYYPAGLSEVDGIKVRRFETTKQKDSKGFDDIYIKQLESIRFGEPTTVKDNMEVIDAQGPYSPSMVEFIVNHGADYNAFMFMTYQYYPFVYALPYVAYKSAIVPTAHVDPMMELTIFRNLFCLPRFICYLTDEERLFVQKLFSNQFVKHNITGVGIKPPENISADVFKKMYNIDGKYILYLGRLDRAKGVDDLISFFKDYTIKYDSHIKLVLIGTGPLEIQNDENIVCAGYVDEQTKYSAIAGAEVTVCSSKYESLCMALLEALALGVPALVNGDCNVLKGHMIKSGAGLYYRSTESFSYALHTLLTQTTKEREQMSKRAKDYVNNNYTWEKVIEKLRYAIDYVSM